MKAYKYRKVLDLVREYQWDSGNSENESREIAKKIMIILTGRVPMISFKRIRCILSKEGIKVFGRTRTGIVIGESRNRVNWSVLWDGNKTPNSYHKDFIELLADPSRAGEGV